MAIKWRKDSVKAIREKKEAEIKEADMLQSLAEQITDLQLALVEAYEHAETQDNNTMLALTEIYEQLLAAQEGGE